MHSQFGIDELAKVTDDSYWFDNDPANTLVLSHRDILQCLAEQQHFHCSALPGRLSCTVRNRVQTRVEK